MSIVVVNRRAELISRGDVIEFSDEWLPVESIHISNTFAGLEYDAKLVFITVIRNGQSQYRAYQLDEILEVLFVFEG